MNAKQQHIILEWFGVFLHILNYTPCGSYKQRYTLCGSTKRQTVWSAVLHKALSMFVR